MTLWAIRGAWNELLWEGRRTPVDAIIHKTSNFLLDWKQANSLSAKSHGIIGREIGYTTWQPPPSRYYKCNVDASFFDGAGKTNFGMCIRDEQGTFIQAITDWTPSCLPVLEGEATGLLKALHWVQDLNLNHVIFELDCQQVVNHVVFPKDDISEYGVTIRACNDFLNAFPNFRIIFVRRQANRVAHCLARATLFNAGHHSFYQIPPCIDTLIINEMP